MAFRDLFSERSSLYSRYRPRYPDQLMHWIAGLVAQRRLAWDCATGTGQAAIGLAEQFEHVIATDASPQQIAEAVAHPRIEYRVAPADDSGLAKHSVDLVTVSQALHWLDMEPFYDEVRRVVVPGGAIVVWGYGDPILDDDVLHEIVHRYNRGTVEDYWMPERQTLLDGYRSIPFPFIEIDPPTMLMVHHWTLDELSGHLRTWSATRSYAAAHGGADPVAAVESDLAAHWGDPTVARSIRWPLHIRAGFVA